MALAGVAGSAEPWHAFCAAQGLFATSYEKTMLNFAKGSVLSKLSPVRPCLILEQNGGTSPNQVGHVLRPRAVRILYGSELGFVGSMRLLPMSCHLCFVNLLPPSQPATLPCPYHPRILKMDDDNHVELI